ncbi:MAG: hypothetical protein IID36_13420 [Planctomycetes bacterium]|nr:hypothetical protein [Planctomycetota bacterium]
MKTHLMLVCLAAIALVIASPALADVCTFVGATNADWNEILSWECCPDNDPQCNIPFNAVPIEGDEAIIPNNTTCVIGDADQEITTLTLVGTLIVLKDRTLTLHGDSTVDGDLGFQVGTGGGVCAPGANDTATLEIANHLTITGDGGTIGVGCISFVIIKAQPGLSFTPILTLENADPGTLTVRANFSTEIDIQVQLRNHARVGIDTNLSATVRLSTEPKTGCGLWFVKNGGTMVVDIAVQGDGTWEITRDLFFPISTLEINAECDALTGTVLLDSVLMDVNEDFCTTGDLTFTAKDKVGRIEVAQDKTASFAGNCR